MPQRYEFYKQMFYLCQQIKYNETLSYEKVKYTIVLILVDFTRQRPTSYNSRRS